MSDVVNALLLKGGRVLLAKRSPQRKSYPNVWSFPGGHVEEGETLEQTLIREIQEEIGVTPTAFRPLGQISDSRVAARAIYHMYAVTSWQPKEPGIRDQEHTELRWFSLSEAALIPDLALEEYRALFKRVAGYSTSD